MLKIYLGHLGPARASTEYTKNAYFLLFFTTFATSWLLASLHIAFVQARLLSKNKPKTIYFIGVFTISINRSWALKRRRAKMIKMHVANLGPARAPKTFPKTLYFLLIFTIFVHIWALATLHEAPVLQTPLTKMCATSR